LTAMLLVVPSFTSMPYWDVAGATIGRGPLAGGGATVEYDALYPAFLAAARLVAHDSARGVQALQAVAAASGASALYLLTFALAGETVTAATAGLLFAIDPLLVRHALNAGEFWLVAVWLAAFAAAFVRIESARGAAIAGVC